MNQKKILIWCGGVVLIFLVISLAGSINTHQKDIAEKGQIKLQEKKSEFQKPEDPSWEQADMDYELSKPNNIIIVDDESALSTENFLSMKAHFMKSEAIGNYLAEQGYDCSEVIVISDSLKKEGNNSYFAVQLLEYPEAILHITWYGKTEEFDFLVVEGEE